MNKLISTLALALVIILTGCSSQKKDFIYLADMQPLTGYPIAQKHESTIQRDDRLKIVVSSRNPELAAPFNIATGSVQINTEGTVTTSQDVSPKNTYRVAANGDIDFPILGTIHLEGLTLTEAAEKIRNLIIKGNYIKDPLVTVDFETFKYTVMGAVGNNGTFTATSDRITLLEAIANAGDLTAKADLGKVTVIREEDNERRLYTHDIRETDIFNSPAFYLKQNDIIYVQPKYAKKDREDRTIQWVTLGVSIVSAATSITWAVTRK